MTTEENLRLEQLQEELKMCTGDSAMYYMGMKKLEELLELLLKRES